jgi:hypothetical protein
MLVSCSAGNDSQTNNARRLSGYEYIVMTDSKLSLTDDNVSGDGEIAFKEAVGARSSNRNFQIEFSLEDDGFVKLKAFASSTLSGAIEVTFSRSNDRVSLSVTVDGEESMWRELKNLNPRGLIALSIDVHNSETPAHVLIWDIKEKSPTDDNAIFNSDADGVLPGNGLGMYWGFALKGATLSKIALHSPESAH